MDSITLFCYWGGTTCQGPDGVSYNKGPNKAIKVNRGMQFDELVDHIYRVTSTDKQQHRIKVMCRYPSVGLGKVIKYVPVPINDNDDVHIMFDVLTLHQEMSTLDLYLEVEENAPILHTEMTSRNLESVVLEEERSNELILTNTSNAILDMIQNDDFYTMSQVAVVSNAMDVDNEVELNEVLEDVIRDEDEEDDEFHETQEHEAPHEDRGEASFDKNVQVPSTFTSME